MAQMLSEICSFFTEILESTDTSQQVTAEVHSISHDLDLEVKLEQEEEGEEDEGGGVEGEGEVEGEAQFAASALLLLSQPKKEFDQPASKPASTSLWEGNWQTLFKICSNFTNKLNMRYALSAISHPL